MTDFRLFTGRTLSRTALAACGLAVAAATPAAAQPSVDQGLAIGQMPGRESVPVSSIMIDRLRPMALQSTPAKARYSTPNGDQFELDRRERVAFFRHADSAEVEVLDIKSGARGDYFLKNDIGRVVVRITHLGGVIWFPSDAPGGRPAFADEEIEPIALASAPADLSLELQSLADDALDVTQDGFQIEVTSDAATDAALVADAVACAIKGLKAAGDAAENVRKLSVVTERRPDVRFRDGVLTVSIKPETGFQGRPSSAKIAHALGA